MKKRSRGSLNYIVKPAINVKPDIFDEDNDVNLLLIITVTVCVTETFKL